MLCWSMLHNWYNRDGAVHLVIAFHNESGFDVYDDVQLEPTT